MVVAVDNRRGCARHMESAMTALTIAQQYADVLTGVRRAAVADDLRRLRAELSEVHSRLA